MLAQSPSVAHRGCNQLYRNPNAEGLMKLLRSSRCLLPAFASVLLAVACKSASGPIPGGIDGVYVARSVDGKTLPATAYKIPGDEYILLGDTLRFSANGTLKRDMSFRRIIVGLASADNVFTYHLTLGYRRDGDTLVIGTCSPHADCVRAEFAALKATNIEIAGSIFWAGEALIKFEQLPPLE